MLTMEQVLENNDAQEGIYIIVATDEQYKEFMQLLNKQGYTWMCGESPTKQLFLSDYFKEEEYKMLGIVLYSNTKTIQYSNLSDSIAVYSAFCKNPKILKPYLMLKEELKRCVNYVED